MDPERFRVVVHPALREIAPEFLERARAQAVEMREALGADDLPRVAHAAHQLGGAGKSFGMPRVSDLGRDIDRALKTGRLDEARACVELLADYLSRVDLA